MNPSIIILCTALLFATGCRQQVSKSETTTEAEAHHDAHTVATLTAAQIKAAGIATGPIEMKNLSTSLSVTGTLAVPNQNKAFVTSLAGGVLRTLEVRPGDHVKKGQLIGTIANQEIAGLQQSLLETQSRLQYAEKEYSRQQELVEGNAAPYKNLQKVQVELNALRSQTTALKRQLAAMGAGVSGSISSSLAITAPISGTISEITAQIGSAITPNAPIAEITNNSELHLDLFVYEKDLPKIATGQLIHFTLTNNPGREYDARIYSIGTAFVNETKAVPVHAHVINEKHGLIEGMSVTALISLDDRVYPTVPDEAIVHHEGRDYIFVVANDHVHTHAADDGHEHPEQAKAANEGSLSFERVEIIRGTSDVGYTEIRPVISLMPDTRVVTKGAFFVMATLTNEGHEH